MNNVLEYLKASAASYPNKLAIADIEHGYTFSELWNISGAFAGYICDTFFYKNRAIGVIADRNADTLVYFMAALMSGNYYVPIDPEMPEAKMSSVIETSEIELVLGRKESSQIVERLNKGLKYASLDDCGPSDHSSVSETLSFDGFDSSSPLYIIYTSGSTGTPKGVLKSHKAYISFIDAYVDQFGFDSSEVIGNQTPFYFDASAKDIYLMLKTGATMYIIPTEYFMLTPSLIKFMNEKGITFISWVPSALAVVVQLNTFKAIMPTTLKKVFFIGEVMPMKHLNSWRAALPELKYVNLYGASENAGFSCYYEVEKEFANDESLPIGKPLGNCKVYLVDNGQIVTEPGKVGEIYVVTDALATEYYKDPEKTASVFVQMDFGEGPVRTYKSGDLAYYDNEGNLIFAARNDSQIKHMGHRIELGEIDTIAGALPEIDRCCTLYNKEKGRIVLFCQLNKEYSELKGNDIKGLLGGKLSSYMIPNKVVIMDALPLNANRKIDRVKLKELL